MTWLSQIGMFLTLGLLATPSEMESTLLPGIALSLILIVVASLLVQGRTRTAGLRR
jgi:cell volume regulation protein A